MPDDAICAPTAAADFRGDALLTLTAPFYEDCDPLAPQDPAPYSGTAQLKAANTWQPRDLQIERLTTGTLTYGSEIPDPQRPFMFGATRAFRERLLQLSSEAIESRSGLRFESIDVVGLLEADGIGAIAVTLRIRDGWGQRDRLLRAVGRDGRDDLASQIRLALLEPISQLASRESAGDRKACLIPYFNATYCGEALHADPGIAPLALPLRQLIYPSSPGPLYSKSPWRDQFFYAGYAFNLLMTSDPDRDMEKLRLLLLLLDVMYARLARTADAAADLQGRYGGSSDVSWLGDLTSRLRADYSALVTPTFSFDHHTLRMRDAILAGWETDKLQLRTTELLEDLKHRVEVRLAQQETRRVNRLNLVVIMLTILSLFSTIESCFELFNRFSN